MISPLQLISVVFNFFFMSLNVFSVCMTVLILSLHWMEPFSEVPAWLARLLLTANRKVNHHVVTHVKGINQKETQIPPKIPEAHCPCCTKQNGEKRSADGEWKEVAKALNKLSFYVSLAVSVIMIIVCLSLWSQ